MGIDGSIDELKVSDICDDGGLRMLLKMGLILVNQNYLLFYVLLPDVIYEEQLIFHFSVVLCVNRIHKNLYLFIYHHCYTKAGVD